MQIDLVDIKQEMYDASKRIEKATKEIYTLAREKAETERDYTIALAAEVVKLREQGMPVTMIQDVARGNVADERYKRDLAKETYVAGRDSLRAIQVQLSALQSILRTQEEI